MSKLLGAKVKSVLSGDSLVLVPAKSTGINDQERILALAYIAAPRIGANETYGFEAREYLRNLLVGKPIQFKVLYTINGREYGDIVTPVFPSLIERVLAEGTAKLRDDADSKDAFDESYATSLAAAQDRAQAAQKGLWAASLPSPVEVLSALPADSVGTEKPGVVERVISGDRVQVRAFIDHKEHFVGPVLIGGIRAPRSSGGDTPAEPFGDASRAFVAQRLLQRSVRINFIARSNTGVPIVSLVHPAGDIVDSLLSSGLASIADWQSQYLGAQRMGTLRAAEKKARDSGLGLWKASAAGPASSSSSYEAIIARVVSPDTYVVRLKSNEEKTVQLASLRSPRKNDAAQEPFVPAAKEFARSHFIAKKVDVSVEAVRPKSEQFEERELVSISLQGKNIASTLVENGWATVVHHRKGEENQRSAIWDELLEKEKAAIDARLGIHSKKAPAASRVIDASETVVKAKGFLSQLERQARIPAVVDYISSGGRLRLAVPRENLILTLVLAGVRVPRPQEPFGDVALDFVSKRLWQRDVHFSVLNVDKTGGFIGHVFLPGQNVPLSVALAKEGLAEVHEFSAQSSGFPSQLEEAGEEAKSAKRGLWKDYVAHVEPEPVAVAASSEPAKTKYVDVVINVSKNGDLFYRLSSLSGQLTKLTADLNSYNQAAANSTEFAFKAHVKKGEAVTVINSSQSYARGRVISFTKPDSYTVELVDVGETRTVGVKSLRPLPSQFSLGVIPGMAKPLELSFVARPPASYLDDYVAFIENNIKGKQLVASFDTQGSPVSATLYTADSKGANDSVNSGLVYDGYTFVQVPAWASAGNWKATIESLRDAENAARADHVGVWEYGDPRDDE